MALTFLLGVRNWNTGTSRRDIKVFDPQAQMQDFLHVKRMMCPPNLCSDVSGFLHEVATGFIHSKIKYWPFLPDKIESHREKLICHLYLAIIHTA